MPTKPFIRPPQPSDVLFPLRYFNFIHLLMCILPVCIFLILTKVLENKTESKKEKILTILAMSNIVLFICYKVAIAVTYKPFVVWGHLPLQLCNINLLLIPIALKTRHKLLCNYLYFMSIWGGYMGILAFDTYFMGRSSLSFIVLAYFTYHAIIAVIPLLMATQEFFIPEKKMISKSLILLLCFGVLMLCVNLIFHKTGLDKEANYFYTMGMAENPILGNLMKLIPVPLLYSLPLAPIIYVFDLAIALPFKNRIKDSDTNENNIENSNA